MCYSFSSYSFDLLSDKRNQRRKKLFNLKAFVLRKLKKNKRKPNLHTHTHTHDKTKMNYIKKKRKKKERKKKRNKTKILLKTNIFLFLFFFCGSAFCNGVVVVVFFCSLVCWVCICWCILRVLRCTLYFFFFLAKLCAVVFKSDGAIRMGVIIDVNSLNDFVF